MRTDISTLPRSCGVYIFRSRDNIPIYIGKAVDIQARVRSHFTDRRSVKEILLQELTDEVTWISAASEMEALVLEDTLIKRYQPRYNVRLKDGKSYPYIVITRGRYPSMIHVRGIERQMGDHYGPHGDPRAVRRSMRWLRKIFPVRSCRRNMEKPSRPCLEYHLGRCMAPCKGDVDEEDYKVAVEGLVKFLSGKRSALTKTLERKMWDASAGREFERAAMIRDILGGLERVRSTQKVVLLKGGYVDVISFTDDLSHASIVEVRDGRVADVVPLSLEGEGATSDVGEEFISSFYAISGYIPPRIVISPPIMEVERRAELALFLSAKAGSRVMIRGPRGAQERSLVEMAVRNAQLFSRRSSSVIDSEESILSLKSSLGLENVPLRIEGFDISHLSGTNTVGSMVQFMKGKPRKSSYRRFRIRAGGNDDLTSMREVVFRRYRRVRESDGDMPDLVLIDGGKGQLNAALSAYDELGLGEHPPTIALAKKEEEIYVEGRVEPLQLTRSDPGLKLLQRIRDEAHRFAVSYQRKTRKVDRSLLEEIEGVGKKRAMSILSSYRSLDEIRDLGATELKRRCSIPAKTAVAIIRYLEGR